MFRPGPPCGTYDSQVGLDPGAVSCGKSYGQKSVYQPLHLAGFRSPAIRVFLADFELCPSSLPPPRWTSAVPGPPDAPGSKLEGLARLDGIRPCAPE